ncbi:MAG: hypothetical protein ACRCS8_00020, partial [Brevinema sp.]
MDNILILEDNFYKEYPFENLLDFGEFKIIKKNGNVYVDSDTGQWELRANLIEHVIDKAILYLKAGKRTYVRKNRFYIQDQSGDLQIKEFYGIALIENNRMFVESKDQPLYKNDLRIRESEWEIEEGDSILLNTVRMTFFNDRIEIEGDAKDYDSSLAEVRNKDTYFEGFPHYTRSPRVIKRIKEAEIEIVQPPPK